MNSTYNTRWIDDIPDYASFDADTRKILLLLCHRKYSWRTEGRLAKASGLTHEQIADILDDLRKKNIVTVSVNRKKQLIHGITARVRP